MHLALQTISYMAERAVAHGSLGAFFRLVAEQISII
jgi:hypothetical protein